MLGNPESGFGLLGTPLQKSIPTPSPPSAARRRSYLQWLTSTLNSVPRLFLLKARYLRLKSTAATGVLCSQEEGEQKGEGGTAWRLFIQRNLLTAGLQIHTHFHSGATWGRPPSYSYHVNSSATNQHLFDVICIFFIPPKENNYSERGGILKK